MMIVGAIVFNKASAPIRDKHSSLLNEVLMDLDGRRSFNLVLEIEKIVMRAVKK
jgi:hypothetical protein